MNIYIEFILFWGSISALIAIPFLYFGKNVIKKENERYQNEKILFEESFVTGRMHYNFFYGFKIKRSLFVTVTRQNIYINAGLPLKLFLSVYGSEHIIPFDRIISLTKKQHLLNHDSVLVEYLDQINKKIFFEVYLMKADEFIDIVNLQTA